MENRRNKDILHFISQNVKCLTAFRDINIKKSPWF